MQTVSLDCKPLKRLQLALQQYTLDNKHDSESKQQTSKASNMQQGMTTLPVYSQSASYIDMLALTSCYSANPVKQLLPPNREKLTS